MRDFAAPFCSGVLMRDFAASFFLAVWLRDRSQQTHSMYSLAHPLETLSARLASSTQTTHIALNEL